MTRGDLSIEGSIWDTVRARVRDLGSMLDGRSANLTEMGKLYERLARTLLDAIQQGGLSSLRFRAAAKALDLKTSKSRLESFLNDGGAPGESERNNDGRE